MNGKKLLIELFAIALYITVKKWYGEYETFYRQEKDWKEKGVPLPRETAANWYNTCALEYYFPIYEKLHEELIHRSVIHADEVPCQVLHEEGRDATAKSYMWVYLSGTDGLPPIVLYGYRTGRSGDHPIDFLNGFTGMLQCDGYAAYGRIYVLSQYQLCFQYIVTVFSIFSFFSLMVYLIQTFSIQFISA